MTILFPEIIRKMHRVLLLVIVSGLLYVFGACTAIDTFSCKPNINLNDTTIVIRNNELMYEHTVIYCNQEFKKKIYSMQYNDAEEWLKNNPTLKVYDTIWGRYSSDPTTEHSIMMFYFIHYIMIILLLALLTVYIDCLCDDSYGNTRHLKRR